MSQFDLTLSSLDHLGNHAYGNSSLLSRVLDKGFDTLLFGSGASRLSGAGGLNLGGLDSKDPFEQQMALIRVQQQIQAEQQKVNLVSNVLKSDHDARMAAIRNIRP